MLVCCSYTRSHAHSYSVSSFFITAAATCAVLIPVNVAYNLINVSSGNRNYLLMLTVSNVRGEYLWCVFYISSLGSRAKSIRRAPVVMTYLLTAVIGWLM